MMLVAFRFHACRNAALLLLSLLTWMTPAHAQFKITQSFTGTSAPGWTLDDNAILTAPSIDAPGSGWLQLTQAVGNQKGSALYTTGSFSSNQSIAIEFNFVAWGGTGADGISVFLYDSTQDMTGAEFGGGLGYCGGAGGYIGIALDEYGNFSNNFQNCVMGGGPGYKVPESLVIRGPVSLNNIYQTAIAVPGGIDNPGVATRPSAKSLIVTLVPATVGYNISVQFRPSLASAYQTLLSNFNFPYAAPATLSLGFSGGTGGRTNFHEIQAVVASNPDAIQVTASGPAQLAPGNTVTYTVVLTNNGPAVVSGTDAPTLVDTLPAGIGNVTWTCVGTAGAVCAASGSGNVNTSAFTLPANGVATFTISGTIAAAAVCNSTLVNSVSADFGTASSFSNITPDAASASVSTTINCSQQSLLANPASLSFGSQTLNQASAPLPVTLSGTDGATVTNIAVTGDFTQTNNCSAPLAGPASCTVNVAFTPTAEGSRNGTLTIQSTAANSPTTIALTGTGTSSVPNNYSFMPLVGVDPSSIQTSNAITVSGTNILAPISVKGGEYSINGGAFTAAAGSVSPGAQVIVRLTASTAFSTPATAVLTIGGVAEPFTVTTRTAQPGQLSFVQSTYTGAGTSSAAGATSTVVVMVTRTGGTDGALTAQVVDSAGVVLGTVTFPAGAGGTQSVALTLTNAAGGGTYSLSFAHVTDGATVGSIKSAQLTLSAAPLNGVTVTSGGGAMSPILLAALGVLVALRWRKTRHLAALAAVASLTVAGAGARAAEADGNWSNFYFGVRGGESTSTLTDHYLTSRLDGMGYQVQADVDRHSGTGTVYAGYDLRKDLSLELAWTYLGYTRVRLSGTTPVELDSLLGETARLTRGSGDALSLVLRYRLPLAQRFGLDLRAGPYGWSTRSDVWLATIKELHETNHGVGYTAGAGPHFMVTPRLGIGVGVDYFGSTSANRFIQETAALDFHF